MRRLYTGTYKGLLVGHSTLYTIEQAGLYLLKRAVCNVSKPKLIKVEVLRFRRLRFDLSRAFRVVESTQTPARQPTPVHPDAHGSCTHGKTTAVHARVTRAIQSRLPRDTLIRWIYRYFHDQSVSRRTGNLRSFSEGSEKYPLVGHTHPHQNTRSRLFNPHVPLPSATLITFQHHPILTRPKRSTSNRAVCTARTHNSVE